MGEILIIAAAVLAVVSVVFGALGRRPTSTYILRRQGETLSYRSIEAMIDDMTPEEFRNLAFSVMVRHGKDPRR
jgi:hypothetical protein